MFFRTDCFWNWGHGGSIFCGSGDRKFSFAVWEAFACDCVRVIVRGFPRGFCVLPDIWFQCGGGCWWQDVIWLSCTGRMYKFAARGDFFVSGGG